MQRGKNGISYPLQVTEVEKDLVVWMDNKFKFSEHVLRSVSKANQILALIRRSFTHLDIFLLKQLYA